MESISELRKICQEPVITVNSWYTRYFTRRVSIYFTKVFLHLPINANQISLLMILMGIIGGVFLALGGYVNGLIGMLFLQLFLIFDCVDGEVARYKNQPSLKGKYLDSIANDIVHVFMFSCLTIGMLNSNYKVPTPFLSHDNVIIVCGLSAITSPLLYKIAVYYVKEIRGEFILLSDSVLKNEKCAPLKSFLRSILHPINVINTTSMCAVFNLLPFVLIGYGIIFPSSCVLSLILRSRNLQ